jgi:hypothetical protein
MIEFLKKIYRWPSFSFEFRFKNSFVGIRYQHYDSQNLFVEFFRIWFAHPSKKLGGLWKTHQYRIGPPIPKREPGFYLTQFIPIKPKIEVKLING